MIYKDGHHLEIGFSVQGPWMALTMLTLSIGTAHNFSLLHFLVHLHSTLVFVMIYLPVKLTFRFNVAAAPVRWCRLR